MLLSKIKTIIYVKPNGLFNIKVQKRISRKIKIQNSKILEKSSNEPNESKKLAPNRNYDLNSKNWTKNKTEHPPGFTRK
jgi:hypothetical protein